MLHRRGVIVHSRRGLSTGLHALFQDKIALGKTLPKLEDNAIKLQMYALYKQATDGPNTQPKPGMFDFVGKAKWEAWTSLGTLSHDDAKKRYCDLIDGLAKGASGSNDAATATSSSNEAAGGIIHSTQAKGIVTMTWDPKTPLEGEVIDELTSAIQKATDDPATKVLVLKLQQQSTASPAPSTSNNIKALIEVIVDFPKPLGVVVHGPVSGLAVSLVGLADVVFSHERATFHILPGSHIPAAPALIYKLGYIQANALLFLGAKLSAAAALRHGLITAMLNADLDKWAFTQFQYLAESSNHGNIRRPHLFRHQYKATLVQE
ncbi:hypothetical protein, variant 1 [Aphanomyces astaci]|uniref:ACB domain-containing protein n=1 Tax=Aphanomyces astaci TaxID=112090 RepID=W4FM90_APHAT|nr:hypothetical protein, variant 1 [Aphanomyces astaci]ETV67944.1 hypothetical protein, variant 1 [Aphanomyces astaci]|eukprot:XP_009842506.1 hypothetical protein, variant 1 [Aphanomyces astaci]